MYPSWRYHATEAPRLIHGPSEERAGWEDSPAKVGRAAVAPQGAPTGTADGMAYETAPITETPAATKTRRVVRTKGAKGAAVMALPPAPVLRATKGESMPPPPPSRRKH